MNPTAARNLVNRLVAKDPEQALSVARTIKEPWFRCQALSHVARYWPHKKYDHFLREAVRAAELQEETYKQVAVSAWPIRAYLERDNAHPARALIKKYTDSSRSIANMGSRSEALFLVFQAAKPFAPDLWQPVFKALVEAGKPSLSWRQGRAIRYAAEMVIADDRQLVRNAVRVLSDKTHLSTLRALKELLDSAVVNQIMPRPFFWIDASE